MRKAIIVDDEYNSRELLVLLVREYLPEVEVLGTAASVQTAIDQIEKHNPDLVFLDIELSGGYGFQVIDAFDHPSFEIIFTSGYHPRIAKALNYAALDYLKKPIVLKELKALSLSHRPIQNEQLELIKDVQEGGDPDFLFISERSAYQKIEFQDIAFVEAQGPYSSIVVKSGKASFSSKPLGHFEKLLPAPSFFKTHRSFLVNLSLVSGYDSGRTGNVHLKCGQSVPLAARRKSQFIQLIKSQHP